jgi:hypothetical protein
MTRWLLDRWLALWTWTYPEAAGALRETIDVERLARRLGPGLILRTPFLAHHLALAERTHPTAGAAGPQPSIAASRLRLAILATALLGLALTATGVLASLIATGTFVFESAPAATPLDPAQAAPEAVSPYWLFSALTLVAAAILVTCELAVLRLTRPRAS